MPWSPAPQAVGLFADDAAVPYAVMRGSADDAGATDFFAQLDDDAGVVRLAASSLPPIVATTTNTPVVVATDDTIYAVAFPSATATTVATTTEHIIDVATDGTWIVWTTTGAANAHLWRAPLP